MKTASSSAVIPGQEKLDLEYGIKPEERAVIEAIRGNLIADEQSTLF